MIADIGTSALIPLIVDEAGSDGAADVWDAADHVISVRLVYAEARAALAHAVRLERFAPALLADVVDVLDDLYSQLDLIEVDDALVHRAGELADDHALRGYDAVHLAGADRVVGDETVLVSGDRDLLAAAQHLGLSVSDTSVSSQDT